MHNCWTVQQLILTGNAVIQARDTRPDDLGVARANLIITLYGTSPEASRVQWILVVNRSLHAFHSPKTMTSNMIRKYSSFAWVLGTLIHSQNSHQYSLPTTQCILHNEQVIQISESQFCQKHYLAGTGYQEGVWQCVQIKRRSSFNPDSNQETVPNSILGLKPYRARNALGKISGACK